MSCTLQCNTLLNSPLTVCVSGIEIEGHGNGPNEPAIAGVTSITTSTSMGTPVPHDPP
jgi:hypothetical protein